MFQTNTPNDPPAATFTATATPSAATVSGQTNSLCSRRLALRRSPYRHVASSSRGGLPTCTRSYACHRISATCAVAAATRPSRAARPRASTFSQRSSRGARFQRLHLGQITHSRPFHESNASRRPRPSPEGRPSPSSLPLQKAQVRYMSPGSGEPGAVPSGAPGWYRCPLPCSLSLLESIHAQGGDVHVGFSSGQEVAGDLSRERRQQHAVAAVAGGVPEALDLRIGPEDGPAVRRPGAEARPHPLDGLGFEARQQADGAPEDLREPLVRDPAVEARALHGAAEQRGATAGAHVAVVVVENRRRPPPPGDGGASARARRRRRASRSAGPLAAVGPQRP